MSRSRSMPSSQHRAREKVLLQATIAVLALLPLFAGAAGVVSSAHFLRLEAPPPVDLDSHLRFLSGLFFAFGLAWYSCIPAIETKTERFTVLAVLTFYGGLARLLSLTLAGAPSTGHLIGLGMELVVVPCLVLWQRRVAVLYEPSLRAI